MLIMVSWLLCGGKVLPHSTTDIILQECQDKKKVYGPKDKKHNFIAHNLAESRKLLFLWNGWLKQCEK